MTEVWRTIPSYPSYFASSYGRIGRRGGSKCLAGRSNGKGYLRVTLSERNIQHTEYVHRLICEAFRGPCPPNHELRHLNGKRQDNREDNLEWATKTVNEADKIIHGTLNHGERNGGCRLLTKALVLEARRRVANGEQIQHVAALMGVTRTALGDAVTGRKWRHLPGATGTLRRGGGQNQYTKKREPLTPP